MHIKQVENGETIVLGKIMLVFEVKFAVLLFFIFYFLFFILEGFLVPSAWEAVRAIYQHCFFLAIMKLLIIWENSGHYIFIAINFSSHI